MAAKEMLSGRYRLGRKLGRGGMATVYEATDTVLERPVAIKVLASDLAGDGEFVERFRREARAAAGLNHPNVVSVFDTGSDDGTDFIVMERVEGQTLADVLAKGPLSPERAAAVAADVARALDAAHGSGIVHRDVKPGNVLLTEAGGVKVADFGIARAAASDSLTRTGAVMGTAKYLSPEQASGGVVEARSDIYSLGCVLYEMLAGRPPFEGDSPVAIATQHVSDEPPAPSSLSKDVPPELEAVVARAMAKDPAARFESAGEMADALAGSVTGEPTEPLAAVGSDTEVITRGGDTRVMRRGGDTSVMPPASAGRTARHAKGTPPGTPWWPWALAAVGLALLGFLLARAASREDETPPVQTPATPPPTVAQTSPPPQEAISLEDAHTAFLSVMDGALADDGIAPEIHDELLGRVEVAMEGYRSADLTEALQELGEAQALAAQAGVEGRISDAWRAPVSSSLTSLALAMQLNPPTPPPDEGGDGGKGKGKGKGKGDDD